MKHRTVGVVLALVNLSCLAAAEKPKSTAQEVSYCDLVKAPQLFSGKRIRVRAIDRYGFEISRLDPPACCSERGGKIWVEMNPGLGRGFRKLTHRFPKGMGLALATFDGTFEVGGPYGLGGYRFRLTVDKIEKIEATSKPSPHEPSWVPKNCEPPSSASPLLPPPISFH